MSNAETHFPSLSPSVSLSLSKRKAGCGNSHTSSVQFNSFQSPMKNTGQREFKNLFSVCCFLSSMGAHACARVCVRARVCSRGHACVCWKLQKKVEC